MDKGWFQGQSPLPSRLPLSPTLGPHTHKHFSTLEAPADALTDLVPNYYWKLPFSQLLRQPLV